MVHGMTDNRLKILDYTFDESLIETCRDLTEPQLDVYVPEQTCVVLGRGSKPDVELNLETCLNDNIPIYRRRGGGCAVVLDPGNVIVSLVLPASGWGQINEYFGAISSWLIAGYSNCGLNGVYRKGYSDLVYENRKIAGACMQRKRDFVYYSTSILVNPDLSLLEKYLTHPPRESDYRKKRPHSEFVVPITEITGYNTAKEFKIELKTALSNGNFPTVQ